MNAKQFFSAMFICMIAVNVFAVPPNVIEAIPDNGENDVDPSLRKIKIVFDQDMTTGTNYSVCGGGEKFPEITGKPKWTDKRTLVLGIKLQPNKEYQFSINCQSFKNCKNINGEAAVPYPISFKTGKTSKPKTEFEEKIAKINLGNCTPEEAVEIFGKPKSKELCDKDKTGKSYVLKYQDGMSIFVDDKTVQELRFKSPSTFSYNGIKIGSSLLEVIKIFGRPGKQVKGKSNDYKDNVLYRNINGQKGFCYYGKADKGVRCFFRDNKVDAIYLTASRKTDGSDGSQSMWTIHFTGKGGFKPRLGGEMLEEFNKVVNFKISTREFKVKKTAKGLVGTIKTNSTGGKNKIEEILKNSSKLEFIKAIRD